MGWVLPLASYYGLKVCATIPAMLNSYAEVLTSSNSKYDYNWRQGLF